MAERKITCSVCGRGEREVRSLMMIAQDFYICNDCVDICHQMMHQGSVKASKPSDNSKEIKLTKPAQIKDR